MRGNNRVLRLSGNRRALVWPMAGLLLMTAALLITVLVANPGSALAQQDCTPKIAQDDTVPDEDFDLNSDFGSNCPAPD